ncbi:Uncharacterised protein [Bordetella pertussis]|nr:Uncharacterised protein [Bordetella pertussis]CFP57038.1 Uncharacterised protein [Bordetella pertussis]CFW32274.1 Uncharacterised protein [Bordetella pertussis]
MSAITACTAGRGTGSAKAMWRRPSWPARRLSSGLSGPSPSSKRPMGWSRSRAIACNSMSSALAWPCVPA